MGSVVEIFVVACVIAVVGGFIKGAVGFAMPLVMVSLLGIFLEPQLVVAGIILPIVTTNFLQIIRAGWTEAFSALREYRIFVGLMVVMIFVSAQFLTRIPSDIMRIVLGIPVMALCLVQLMGLRLVIAPKYRMFFSTIAGILAGILGGLAGTWGPPTVLYLLAVETPKARQMAVQGVIYGVGAVALLIGHLQSGVLNWQTAPFSASLIPPALLGMWLGFKLGARLDQEKFRKMTLIVLAVAGANLIRRGLIGD